MVKVSCMLLSNLTQVSAGAIKLLQVDVKNHARRGTHVVQLLQLFAGYRGWDRGITESLADPYVDFNGYSSFLFPHITVHCVPRRPVRRERGRKKERFNRY
jgi:hypothetical protein